jgi:hypothetical protein
LRTLIPAKPLHRPVAGEAEVPGAQAIAGDAGREARAENAGRPRRVPKVRYGVSAIWCGERLICSSIETYITS